MTRMERMLMCGLFALAGGPPAGGAAEPSALDREIERIEREEREKRKPARAADRIFTAPTFRFIDTSLTMSAVAGFSGEKDAVAKDLQGGEHDPKKRGFNVRNVELSFAGAVDPYFTAETHFLYFLDEEGESRFELEEAFVTTQALPGDLQLEVGQMFTEFGRLNPRHPHQWHWQDQPVIHTRLFGPDGLRGPGFRLGWLAPLPWFSEVHYGLQNANGETMVSFLSSEEVYETRPVGGRAFVEREVRSFNDLTHLARWHNAWEWSDTWSSAWGVSALLGPNATGKRARTSIYGADFVTKWRPVSHERGWPFVLWEAEYLTRDFDTDGASYAGPDGTAGTADDVFLPGKSIRDWGYYAQVLYGFRLGWAAGLRLEYASAHGSSFDAGNAVAVSENTDFYRDQRLRVSPLVSWFVSEFSRVRLQYNFDRARHLRDANVHSLWLGFDILIGKHPAHQY